MSKEKPTTRVLRAARARLAKRGGWCKNDYWNDGSVCAVGAINLVVTGDPAQDNGYCSKSAVGLLNRVARTKGFKKGINGDAIVGLNDAPKTRKKDVLEVYDKAIELSLS